MTSGFISRSIETEASRVQSNRPDNWQRVGGECVDFHRTRRLQPTEKVWSIIAVGTPTYSKQEHAGSATFAPQRRVAIGIPLDHVFSLGVLGAKNEIKNYLAIFRILERSEIHGWIGRLAFVEHIDLGSHRAVDIDSLDGRFDQYHPLETFACLPRR